jgi:hypothetical protein
MRTEQSKSTEDEAASVEAIEPVTVEPAVAVCNESERNFWQSIGLPYCDKCCSPLRSDDSGNRLCTLQLAPSECPLQH